MVSVGVDGDENGAAFGVDFACERLCWARADAHHRWGGLLSCDVAGEDPAYTIMDKHFHILLKVPEQKVWLKRFEGKEGEQRFF